MPPSIPSTFMLILLGFSLLRRGSLALAAVTPLWRGFYAGICPEAEHIVRETMRRAMDREPRSAASVMRLQFHDCFVNGCDGSLLLDDSPTMIGEKLSLSNINSLRSYEVIDEAKEELENVCPGIVSCADIIIMASRDAVALVWFFEHTSVQRVVHFLARPRICRWSDKMSYNAKFCFDLPSELKKPNQLRFKFSSVEEAEKRLLGPEEPDSDFEDTKQSKRKGRGVKKVNFELDSDFEDVECAKEKMKKIAAKSEARMLRKMEKEKNKVKSENRGEDWEKMESRLRGYVREEVEKVEISMKNYCDTLFKKLQDGTFCRAPSPTSPSSSTPQIIPLHSPAKKPSSVKVKKIAKKDLQLVPIYPGKAHIKPHIRDSIDLVLSEFKERSDVIFSSGNIVMTRGDLEDLLGKAWITDAHIDAYAAFLGSKQSRSSDGMKSFLYISPNHAYYKSSKVSNSKILLSHITLASVTSSEIMLMPCHLSSHWTLLVCRQKDHCWDFYDSSKSGRHRSNLSQLVKILYEEVSEALPADIIH